MDGYLRVGFKAREKDFPSLTLSGDSFNRHAIGDRQLGWLIQELSDSSPG